MLLHKIKRSSRLQLLLLLCTFTLIVFLYYTTNPSLEIIVEDFQKISDVPAEKLYLYSAYFDAIDSSIKVIGGGKASSTLVVYCQYYNQYKKSLLQSPCLGALADLENEVNEFKYRAVWVRCPIMESSNDTQPLSLPAYVSIFLDLVVHHRAPPTNLFQVKYNSLAPEPPSINFTVCVRPTFSYDSPLRFLEWIEYYKLMGVEHFIFANDSIGPATSCLMRQYQQTSHEQAPTIEILKWSPVFARNLDIHAYGQRIQINDCLYRSRGRSQYVIPIDFDELIMPGPNVSNYMELIESIESQKPSDVGDVAAYLFSNGFFYLNKSSQNPANKLNLTNGDDDNELESQIYSQLFISTTFTREGILNFPIEVPKYIARPDLVVRGHVHYVKESISNSTTNYVVPSNLGYLHHYRSGPPMYIRTVQSAKVIDKSGLRFARQLSKNVAEILKKFGKICDIL